MSVKVFIVGKENPFCALLKRRLKTYAIEVVFVQKTPTSLSNTSADAWVFLDCVQAEAWMRLAPPPSPSPPALLLPEPFPPPIPFATLAQANVRLMPRETEGFVLAKQILLDIELGGFSKSIADLSQENQQPLLEIFEEFRHTLGQLHLHIRALLTQLPHATETLSQLRTLIHRLAGSTGSYGFLSLSNKAKAVENAIADNQLLLMQSLADEFLEMLSLVLPPRALSPPFSKTLLIYAPEQQARSPCVQELHNLHVNALWAMDWVECWKLAQNYAPNAALLSVDNLPLSAWPELLEALSSAPSFAALPKYLVKHNANDAERACAAHLNCFGPAAPPSTAQALAEMLRALPL